MQTFAPYSKILLTPDLYAREVQGTYPDHKKDCNAEQESYVSKLYEAPSDRICSQHYMKHKFYKDVKWCFPDAYTIDPSIFKERVLIHIITKSDNLNQVVETSNCQGSMVKITVMGFRKHIVD